MANVKTTMTDIRVIIREFSRGTSLREMERKLKLSRTSLRAYRDRAEASGKCMIDLLKLNDAELQAIMQRATDIAAGMPNDMPSCRKMWKNHDYKYHNTYEPGREMQFDFAGDNLWIVDKETGEAVQAIVLVCLLPYSMLSYVTALPSAKMEYLFRALSRAVRYFGGVAEVSKRIICVSGSAKHIVMSRP